MSIKKSPHSRCSSALRLSTVLYGSGTDAGWVRLYDAAAPAAISSAAKPHKHTANTEVIPRDSPPPLLLLTARILPTQTFTLLGVETDKRGSFVVYSWLREKAQDPGFTAPALDAFFSLDRAWQQEGNQPWLQGLLLYTGLCFLGFETNIDSRRLCRSFGCFAAPWGSIQPDLSVPWSPHQPGPERRKEPA